MDRLLKQNLVGLFSLVVWRRQVEQSRVGAAKDTLRAAWAAEQAERLAWVAPVFVSGLWNRDASTATVVVAFFTPSPSGMRLASKSLDDSGEPRPVRCQLSVGTRHVFLADAKGRTAIDVPAGGETCEVTFHAEQLSEVPPGGDLAPAGEVRIDAGNDDVPHLICRGPVRILTAR